MAQGTVEWFNSQKGFGFIQPDDGGKDRVRAHQRRRRAGMRGVNGRRSNDWQDLGGSARGRIGIVAPRFSGKLNIASWLHG